MCIRDRHKSLIMESKNFSLQRIKGRYVVLEILSYILMEDCLPLLWTASKRGRAFISSTFREINNVMVRNIKAKLLDMTHKENLLSAF